MPDAEKTEAQEAAPESGSKGSLIRLLAVLIGVVLIGATASLVVFKLVLQPRLSEPQVEEVVESPSIPPEPFMVPFESALATVLMPSDDYLASTLMYAVELECSDQMSMDLVMKHKARFTDMIRKVHSGRTRDELKDEMTDDNIQKQIVQQSNAILGQILGDAAKEHRVTNAFHTQWYVKDE